MITTGYDALGRPIQEPTSMNNRLILSEYVNAGQLKREVQHGIAMVSQKINLAGLTVLVGARLTDGTVIHKGSKAFIKEGTLHTSPWAKSTYQSEGIEGKFIIVEMTYIEFIMPPEQAV